MPNEIIKTCSCSRDFTREEWDALPSRGMQYFAWGEAHEQRNCPCGSTIVLVLDEGCAEDPLPGTRWVNKITGRAVQVVEWIRPAFDIVGYCYIEPLESDRGVTKWPKSRVDFYREFTPYKTSQEKATECTQQ
jgi:hypothetical protein